MTPDRNLSSHPPIPRRPLGRTGQEVTIFGLGGEGVLRTHGRDREAVRVIHRALDQGVTYFDTAPAYAGSMDYYGVALGERREEIFLASKTHDRSRDGSLRLLDDSLRRLRTDRLDLWQLHDLRTYADLERIFGRGGAIEALVRAREERRVRYLGVTGHHDPQVLIEALRRFDFDTVLVALNAADSWRLPFATTVLREATLRGMGVIAMKVAAQGALLGPRALSMREALGFVLSLPGVSTAIVGCATPEEVDENAGVAREHVPLGPEALRAIEARACASGREATYFKRP